MYQQENSKSVFAFATYTKKIPSKSKWRWRGVVVYEEIDWLNLKYIIIHFDSSKHTNEVKRILDSFSIKVFKLGSQQSEIISFDMKDAKKKSVVYRMIHKHKMNGSHVRWTTEPTEVYFTEDEDAVELPVRAI